MIFEYQFGTFFKTYLNLQIYKSKLACFFEHSLLHCIMLYIYALIHNKYWLKILLK